MNGNGGTSSQGTPDEAKNLFNIGSTKAQNSGGSQILDIDDLSANTAHGPALDGRTIPHMVAPGCSVDSSDTLGGGYGLKCGTSMASPHVSGAVALFMQYYRGLPDYTTDPSPALVKAAFLPVAHNLAGFSDADGGVLGNRFDSKQGWGRMDLPAVVNPNPNGVQYVDQPVILDNTGDEWSNVVSPLDPAEPVRIMLVWTDAPGHGLGGSTPAWNNDLDLIVDADAQYLGNNFGADGFSVPGGTADAINNTEGVFLAPGAGNGGINIRVNAANINSDGVPSIGDDTDQDFAVVCYNCAVEPGFTVAAAQNSQSACAPTAAAYTLDVGQILDYTETVTLSATGAPAGASVIFSQNPVTPPANVVMTVSNTGAAAAGSYDITVTGTTVDQSRSINVGLDLSTAAPDEVSLSSPSNGATDVSRTPTLAWAAASQASSYYVQVSPSPTFNTIAFDATLTDTSTDVAVQLSTLTTYYWRVMADNACGASTWSDAFSFVTLDQPDYFTEEFAGNDNDLAGMKAIYIPDGSGDYYDACVEAITEYPTDPVGGNVLPLTLDDSDLVTPTNPVTLYGTTYNSFYVGSNGYITFTGPDLEYIETLADHFDTPRISALFDDFNVPNGGTVSWTEKSDRVVVTWDGIPEYVNTGANFFQVEMFGNGEIHISWLSLTATDGLVGLSDGNGIPTDYIESDASAGGTCTAPCAADIVNNDGQVNFDDLALLLGFWGPCGAGAPCQIANLNTDGASAVTIDFDDLAALLGLWGVCP